MAETLVYEGQTYAMCSNPLDDYFLLSGTRPEFAFTCTALWRGYQGRWEIIDDRLYLTALTARLEDGSDYTLANLFPEHPDRVFAHWYSDTIRIPKGKLLQYVHMGYASTYEQDLFVDIERGIVVATRVQSNGIAAEPQSSGGYTPGAFTTFAE